MRKIITISLMILICVFFAIKVFDYDDEIRVRVIPNSNNVEDLKIKSEVQTITVKYLEECYHSEYKKYKYNILKSMDNFNKKLEKYDAIASLENHTFYSKTYNGSSVKDETSLTFLVKIGDALGDNWWGVIYPNFLEISSSDKAEYKSFIKELFDKVFN